MAATVSSYSSSYFKILFFSLSLLANISVSSFLSVDIFGSHSLVGRNLLQTKKDCPVNFEFQNYTVITSQCKGPKYLPEPCCKSFKEFACPFRDELNDLSNKCSETMFSYIDASGNYPAALFSSFCTEGKEGLDCSAFPTPPAANDTNGVRNTRNWYQSLMFTAFCLVSL